MPATVAELSPSPSEIFALRRRSRFRRRYGIGAVAGRDKQMSFDRAGKRERIVAVAELRTHAAADDGGVRDRHEVGAVATVNRQVADFAGNGEIVVAIAE